ncbi:MAG: type II toxin-antitoxin system RelE/ParE family toxin [Deltaproteobacteria bacterium]|nr:type II toxin-antitoxin system RelE/ParE family toxin [Deltaproteobacteria bacterium]
MNYTLRFLPEIEEDVIAGYSWYEGKSTGLGEDFLRMFYAYSGEIPRAPLLYPRVHGNFHRRLLRRFPYAIYYIIENSQIIVFGLFHCARDPRTIKAKLQDRKDMKRL